MMPGEVSLCDKYQVDTFVKLQEALWKVGSSAKGVFGLKYPRHHNRYIKIFEEVKALQHLQSNHHEEALSAIFLKCKHIYLARRNKVRQVVSWWRAIQDNV